MGRLFLLLVASAGLSALAGSSGAGAGAGQPAAPRPLEPRPGATVQALSAFSWRPVAGADHYELQIGADPGFDSPVLGLGRDSFPTANAWATVDRALPNGRYWWRVRAVTAAGAVSPWSRPRVLRKQWRSSPRLLSPASGAEIRFPLTPLVLRWSGVPYAAKYLVFVAKDAELGTLVGDRPVETEGLSYAPSVTLPLGTYYWAVTPVDAQGNRGTRSPVASFRWVWDSRTRPSLRDLVPAPEHFDPQLSWTPVLGAARYEVEINPSREWAAGSRVCCRDPLVTTVFSPTQLLANNRYYWRVRAINVDGGRGRERGQGARPLPLPAWAGGRRARRQGTRGRPDALTLLGKGLPASVGILERAEPLGSPG